MPKSIPLQYHQRTFDLLNEAPRVSKANLARIEKWEKDNGREIPGAVREWYMLTNSRERLEGWTLTSGFFPSSLKEILDQDNCHHSPQLPVDCFHLGGLRSPVSPDPIVITSGNSSDPRTINLVDEDYPQIPFSTFCFQRCWAKLLMWDEYAPPETWGWWWGVEYDWPENFVAIEAYEPGFDFVATDYLKDHFSEGDHRFFQGTDQVWRVKVPLREEWIERQVFAPVSSLQFYSPDVRIQIVCKGDPTQNSVDSYWRITANSEQDLEELLCTKLWKCGTLSRTFTSSTKGGRNVLKALRRRRKW